MQYKEFITAGFLMLGYIVSPALELPALPSHEGMTLKGYVHDGTAGIPGVLVTDGYTFASTDADGSYYLAGNDKAWCVYVILPSGYEYGTVEQGIVKHFVNIDKSLDEQQADFLLNPIGDDTNFSFLSHADTQPDEYVSATCWNGMMDAYKDMQATGLEIKEKDGFMPFNLHMGDIIYNTPGIYADFRKYKNNLIVCDYTIPMLPTPGNHDRRYKVDYMEATELYRETFGPLWYSFNRGEIHFISMDNVKVEIEGEYTRGYSDDAVEWLKKDLSYVDPETPIIFFSHQTMTKGAAMRKAFKPVLDLLAPYKTYLFTGHAHKIQNVYGVYHENIRERNQASIGAGGWRSPCCVDGTPNGYTIYTVKGKEISWKYKWTKRDPDKYMFRLYNPGDIGAPNFKAEEEKVIYTNIWDWDEDWANSWRMQDSDGNWTEMGALKKCEGEKDPWAAYNIDGRTEGAEASVSDHLFRADVPNTCAKIEVTVTDPFGRTITNSLSLKHVDGIETITTETSGIALTEVFDLSGVKVFESEGYPYADTLPLAAGVYVYRMTHADGSVSVEKQAIK